MEKKHKAYNLKPFSIIHFPSSALPIAYIGPYVSFF